MQDFAQLTWRAVAEIYRNFGALTIRCGTVLFFAVLLSLIYQNLGNSQQSIQDRIGLLYFLLINQSFGPLVALLTVFPAEKVIVSREILGGAYKTSAYYIGRVIAELPGQIVITVVYATVIYWSVGLNPLWYRFLLFIVIILLTTLCAMTIGFMISACSPSAAVASAAGPPLLIILLLFGGFYINVESLPPGSEWVRFVSLVYWGFQALIVNEFAGQRFECNPNLPLNVGCTKTGEEVILSLSFQGAKVGNAAGVLVALCAGFLLIGYIGLLFTREKYSKLHPVEKVLPAATPAVTVAAAGHAVPNSSEYLLQESGESKV
mmetsp:Transcript_15892/g.26735  ORF Transcript_15892/g.26735 Transcript_15892/m.26735 type:complete len:320 (+) Transcript_15892:155-1114(+)